MDLIRTFLSRIASLFRREHLDASLDEELRAHIDLATEENMKRGMTRRQARTAALRSFGGITQAKEAYRTQRGFSSIEILAQDVRYSLRMMHRNPTFSAVAFATLAIGISAMTLTFSLANAVLFKPLSAKDPQRLVALFASVNSSSPYSSCSYPDYRDLRDQFRDVFSDVAAYTIAPATLQVGSESQHVTLGLVSANYFQTLGVDAVRGRLFSTTDDSTSGSQPVAVITEKLWKSKFQGDDAILGMPIHLNKQIYIVIGVIGQEHASIRRFFETDAFVPASTSAQLGMAPITTRNARQYFMLARLRPDASLSQAKAKALVVAYNLQMQLPQSWRSSTGRPGTIRVVSERDSRVPPQARTGVMLTFAFMVGMSAVLLLIVCSNIGNLALARALSRQKEIAIRLAIGSTRWRVIRQMLTESGLIATVGGFAAYLLTVWVSHWLMALHQPMEISVALNLNPDYRVFFFSLVTIFFSTLVVGLPPALQVSATDLSSVTKDSGTRGRSRKFSLRNSLVAIEVAFTIVLLVPAGLFMRSLQSINRLDLGFDRSNVTLISLDLDPQMYLEQQGQAAYGKILQHIRNLPEVVDAGFASTIPLSGQIEDEEYAATTTQARKLRVMKNQVGSGYFEAMRIPLLQGRFFRDADTASARRVAIVNRAFVQQFWPGEDGIGKYVIASNSPDQPIEIVGVVQTGIYNSLGEPATPFLYRPLFQDYSPSVILHIRTRDSSAASLQGQPHEIEALLPHVVAFNPRTMNQQLALSIAPFQAAASSLTIVALIALGLAIVGIYGIATYSAARRTQEIGIRMALGAPRGNILWMIARQGVFLVTSGALLGIPIAIGAGFAIKRLLFGVAQLDLLTYLTAFLSVILVGIFATIIPASRATRINPVTALRSE